MAAPAVLTQGTTFTIEDDGGTPVTINGVQSLSGVGSGTANKIDTTTLASTAKEYRMGLQDNGDFTMTFLWNGDDLGQAEMQDAKANQSTRTMVITFPATDPVFADNVLTIDVLVLAMSFDVAVDGVLQGSATLSITGDMVWS